MKEITRFNQLTDSEDERLSLLMEELAEAIQIIGKIKRHGYESFNPFDKDKVKNRELLEKELGDVKCAIKMMVVNDDLDDGIIDHFSQRKEDTVAEYLHHQDWPEYFENR